MVDVIERKLPLKEILRRQHSRVYREKMRLTVCKDNVSQHISQKLVVLDGKENCRITSPVVKPRNPRPAKGFNWTDEDQIFLKEFFDKIPKAPSHYCRKDTKKVYLTPLVRTLTKLYEIYKARCKALQKCFFFYFYVHRIP